MNTHSLTISKHFNAPKEKVFHAWSDAQSMLQWMGPGSVTCERAEVDFTVGGAYEIYMQTEDGPMTAYGEYIEINPTDKLAFTWGWRQNALEGSLVTLTFKAVDDGTLLTLEHSGLPAPDVAEHHKMGWTAILEKLITFV